MKRWMGFLGSWALLVLGLGLASFAMAGEVINVRDDQRLSRVTVIDKLIAEKGASKTAALRQEQQAHAARLGELQSKEQALEQQTADPQDSDQTVLVSTAENKVYVRKGGQTIFEAICSTGKGTTLAVDGRTMIFDTPIGKFRIRSKEENPQWVPPDWHYVEQARKNGMRVVRLNPGTSVDANTGDVATSNTGDSGVWGWFGSGANNARTLKVKNGTVVEVNNGVETELPPGKMIVAGNTMIIPPVDTPQRHFDKVLGHYRLNLGDGYALHGTQETAQLGQRASHGCVRLGDADIEKLYSLTKVGDEVVIY